MARVKICGITRVSDARVARDAGADAIGFVFARSARRIGAEDARRIRTAAGPWISAVGVFVNASVPSMVRTARRCGLDVIQLHGDEKPAVARALRAKGFKVVRAVRVSGRPDKAALARYPADAILLDSGNSGAYGGTGRRFDWKWLKDLNALGKPVIVSGGLTAGNVRGLLKRFKPYGVDVSSGVERSPGRKDPKKMREFIRNAKTS